MEAKCNGRLSQANIYVISSFIFLDEEATATASRDIETTILRRPQGGRFGVLPLTFSKELTPWCLTPKTTCLWKEMFIQNVSYTLRMVFWY